MAQSGDFFPCLFMEDRQVRSMARDKYGFNIWPGGFRLWLCELRLNGVFIGNSVKPYSLEYTSQYRVCENKMK